MDIRPPKKSKMPQPRIAAPDQIELLPAHTENRSWYKKHVSTTKRHPISLILVLVGVLLLAASISTVIWYHWAIGAVSSDTKQVRVIVDPGETATSIAKTLYDHDLIRSRLAFSIYAQLSGSRSKLQAGGYVLSANQDVKSIVEHMVNGKTDEINVTIPPGLTLDELRAQFLKDGYTDSEITTAFEASYSSPLLASRPAGSTLEGYIYPETYRMNADQPLEALLTRTFDQMYQVLQEKKYLDEFSKKGLTIHQALTLASIVQKEVKSPSDQKQVAQVFLKRLADGMQLGSDVTYMYAATQLGVPATPALDSPYNTRKYIGLPPGPIANMNPTALEAVASPASGDFLYFVAGDDGVTYYSHTVAEHEANIKAHCHSLCR